MTPRAASIAVSFTLTASLLVLALGGMRLSAAGARADAAGASYFQLRRDAGRVLALRARAQRVAAGAQPEQDIFRRVNGVLAGTGLSQVRVQSISPGGDQALEGSDARGPARRVQTVRIVLEPIVLDELGAFLDRWRRDQALWAIVGIDLAASAPRGSPGGSYRATLTASAVYVADARPGPRENRTP